MEKSRKKIILLTSGIGCFIIAGVAILIALAARPIRDSSYKAYLVAKNNYLDGNFTGAKKSLDEIVKREPKFFQAKLLLAKTDFFNGDYKEADALLGGLVKRYPMYAEAGLWKARTEIQLNKVPQAKARIEKLLSWQSDDPRLLYYLGKIGETQDDIRAALDYYNRAAMYEEENGKIRLEMGRLYWKLEMPDRALAEVDRAILLLPEGSALRSPALEIKARIEKAKKNGAIK